MLYGAMQDKNEVVLSGRKDGGQSWAEAASARAPAPPLGQYEVTPQPDCAMQPPGTATEMENGFRRLSFDDRGGQDMVYAVSDAPDTFVIPRNNYHKRSV